MNITNKLISELFSGTVFGAPSAHVFGEPADVTIPIAGYKINLPKNVFGASNHTAGDAGTDKVYEFMRKLGYSVKEVPHRYIKGAYGDYIGYKDGKNIYIGTDVNGRPLSQSEKNAIAWHEYGHESTQDDAKAHEIGIKKARKMGDYEALKELFKMGERAGWLRPAYA